MRIKRIFFRHGQSLIELASIIGIVGLVLIGMEIYFKRGLQGKVKDLTDHMISNGHPAQAAYEQDASGLKIDHSSSTLSVDSTITSKELKGGGRSLVGSENTTNDYNSTTVTK